MGINELLALIGALGGLEAIKWVVNFYVNRKTNARKEDAAADAAENENERKQIAWLEERIAQRDAMMLFISNSGMSNRQSWRKFIRDMVSSFS